MNFSPITADLFIGTTPSKRDYDKLRELDIRLIINMRFERMPHRDPHPTPIERLWLPSFDTPLILIPIKPLLRGAIRALDVIQNGGKVYTHCAYGIHRGVVMGACILIAQGISPLEAMELIKSKRPQADPDAFHIRPRILKFAKEWQKQSTG